MKIAQIAPPWFAVPPTGYGGIELVVAILADGLAERGHDVTLFASGGSRTKANARLAARRPAGSGAARQRVVRHLSRHCVVPRDHRRVRRGARPQRDHRAGHGRAARPDARRWCTPFTARGPSRRAASTRCSRSTCTSSPSASRSAPTTPTSRTRAWCTTASTSTATRSAKTRTTSSSTSGAPTPTRARRSRSRSPAAPASRSRW